MMANDPEVDRKLITIVLTVPGYAHTRLEGTCGPDVTVADIRREMYHVYWGGRDAWVNNGRWGCVRHDD